MPWLHREHCLLAKQNEAALGVLLEYGTHLVDMVLTLLGVPVRTYARLHRFNPRARGESLALVVYEYPVRRTNPYRLQRQPTLSPQARPVAETARSLSCSKAL